LFELQQIIRRKGVATPFPSHEGSNGFLRNAGSKELEHFGDGWNGVGRSREPTIDFLYGDALDVPRFQCAERYRVEPTVLAFEK
jgi:hypothetical protein